MLFCYGSRAHSAEMMDLRCLLPAWSLTCLPALQSFASTAGEFQPLLGQISDTCQACSSGYTSYAGSDYCTIPYVDTTCSSGASAGALAVFAPQPTALQQSYNSVYERIRHPCRRARVRPRERDVCPVPRWHEAQRDARGLVRALVSPAA